MPRACALSKRSERRTVPDTIKIEVEIEPRAAIAALSKLDGAYDALEKTDKKFTSSSRSSWKLLTTDIDKLGGALEKSHPKLHAFGSSVGNVAKGVAMGAGAVAAFAIAAAKLTGEIEQNDAAVRRLGDAYGAITVATNGAVSAQQALSLQGSIQTAGIRVSAQQLAVLSRATREYALATGNDAAHAVEKLTNAIVNNSEDALSELGLAQARAATSTETLANMTRLLEERYRGVAPAARTFNEDLAKVPDALMALSGEAMRNALSGLEQLGNRFSSTGRGATDFFRQAAAGWRELIEAGDTLRNRDQQQRSTENMERGRQQRERTSQWFREGNVRLNEVNAANFGDLSSLSAAERARVNRAANPLFWTGGSASESVNRELAMLADERLQRQGAEGQRELQRAEQAADVQRKLRKLGDSAEHAAHQLTNVQRAAAMGLRSRGGVNAPDANEFSDQLGRLAAPTEGELSAEAAARTKSEAAFAEERAGAERDREQSSRRANRDRETRRQARSSSPLGRLGAALGLERDDITGALKPLNALDMGVKGLASTLGVLQSGFAEFFTTVASGAMSAGDAAIVMGSKFLSTLGQMAIQEGTTMLFKAIPAAFEAPPLAAAYVAGGLGLIGVGVGLGVAGASVAVPKPSAGGGTGASASTDRNGLRSASSSTSRERSYGDYNVTFSSFVPAGVVDAINARNALRRVRRAGYDDGARIPRRVEH